MSEPTWGVGRPLSRNLGFLSRGWEHGGVPVNGGVGWEHPQHHPPAFGGADDRHGVVRVVLHHQDVVLWVEKEEVREGRDENQCLPHRCLIGHGGLLLGGHISDPS